MAWAWNFWMLAKARSWFACMVSRINRALGCHLCERLRPADDGSWRRRCAAIPRRTRLHGNYREWATASDALALIAALGYERATIVGHDWGAAAAYVAATLAPERVENLIALAVPFGPAFARAMMFDDMQRERSWYWFFFQLPFAEAAIAHNDFALVERLWRTWSPSFVSDATDIRALKQRLATPGVLPEILSYYRQTLSAAPSPPPEIAAKLGAKIEVPTVYLHGREDGCIGVELGADTSAYFAGRYEHRVIDGVGHFLHAERPDLIAGAILAFLNSEPNA
jgi:pimeloyl-ACP methyl ester carboxylesterase